MATITSLGFNITSNWNGNGVRAARRDLRRLTDDMDRNNAKIGKLAGSVFNLQTALVALGPAIAPIGTVATGVVGGLTAIGTAAGSALGIYAAAMKGAISEANAHATATAQLKAQLDQHKAALARLKPGTAAYRAELLRVNAAQKAYDASLRNTTPAQRLYVQNVSQMKAAWSGFIRASSPMTLSVASVFIGAITASISKLLPVVRAVHPIVAGIAMDFRNWVQGGGLDRFINLVIKYGVPGLRAFVNAGKSVISVLGTGFRAFLPLGLRIAQVIQQGAASLQRWADGGGFTRFLARVKADGPGVGAFFKALFQALGNVMAVLRATGPLSLSLVTILLRLVAALPPSWIKAVYVGFLLWKAALLGLMIIRTITTLVYALRVAMMLLRIAFLASPVGVIVTGLVLIGTAIYLLATKTRVFQNIWRVVWSGVRAFGLAVWHGLQVAFNATLGALRSAWNATAGFFKRVWSATWGWIRSTGIQIWNAIRAFFIAGWNYYRNAFTGFLRGVQSVWRVTWNGIKAFGISVWNGLRTAARSLWSFLTGGFRTCVSGISKAWNRVKEVVAAPIRFVVNSVFAPLTRAWNSIVSKVGLKSLSLPVPHFAAGGLVGGGTTKLSVANKPQNFADGGTVRGPGGPRSDKVPAMLSAGEYVIPAHVVRAKGAGFFDQLIGSTGSTFKSLKHGVNGGNGRGGIEGHLDIPGPIGGAIKAVGGAISKVGDFVKNIASSIKDWVLGTLVRGAVEKLLISPFKGLLGHIPGAGIVSKFLGAAIPKILKGLVDKLMGENAKAVPKFAGGQIPAGQHAAIIKAALAAAHVPPPGTMAQWLAGMNTLITRESGWNANAINRTDSNAKAGHPSQGLAQTIPSTFNAYVPASLRGRGILDPVANVAAAIRYIVARYGNITNVQQANASLPPKGYALGGLAVNSFDRGGYLPKGLSLAYNGTGRPEPVGHHLGGYTFEFHNCTFSGGRGDFEDMVVEAVSNARRKRRIP